MSADCRRAETAPARPTVESEADYWHDEYPYDWPDEASDRIIARLREEESAVRADYSTNTPEQAAMSAAWDAYPDTADLSDYDALAEREWSDYDWPRETTGPLLEALRAALCDLCGVRAGTDHGLCRACADFLREGT